MSVSGKDHTQQAPASPRIPEKLRDDAIIEALCVLQFTSAEVAEVVLGRLSDALGKKDYTLSRLPFADIPPAMRDADANLRLQPVFELRHKDKVRCVRLSERLISYHRVGPKNYSGWSVFRAELREVFAVLFDVLREVKVTSIGFRYINAFVAARHHIGDVHDLHLETVVAGQRLTVPINLNYLETSDKHVTTTRVAHPRFVQGQLPQNTTAIVDVEVNTPARYQAADIDTVMNWVEDAHTMEKEAFFRLIKPESLARLVER